LNVGSRLELFVDGYLIDTMTGLTRELHQPTLREAVISFDAPWEGPTTGFVTILRDEDRYRLYFPSDRGNEPSLTAYAESPDGIHWTKPNLGIVEFNGSKENNLIWAGPLMHNFNPFRDRNPAAREDERYKALGGDPAYAFVSSDGLHWRKMQEEPVITQGAFDSQNLAFWDEGQEQYVAYLRHFQDGVRTIRRATSPDFLHWTPTEPLDFGDAPLEHLYTNAITPYFRAPHLLIGLPMRFVPDRQRIAVHPYPGVSDGVFMTSRDGLHFQRFLEAFIRPGLGDENWTERTNMPAWGIVPTGPEEISVYWVEHYRHPTIRLRRGTLRPDGFVSVHAPYAGGEFVTKPLVFAGKELVINYSTSAVGSVRVEIQEAAGPPLADYTLADCPEVYGDEIEQVVAWKGGSDVSALAGRPVRLRFVLKDADLYALRFR
jgi:hypothetical protein